MVDSYHARRFPLFHLKIRADLTQFTKSNLEELGGTFLGHPTASLLMSSQAIERPPTVMWSLVCFTCSAIGLALVWLIWVG
jgi:hypothetical protein